MKIVIVLEVSISIETYSLESCKLHKIYEQNMDKIEKLQDAKWNNSIMRNRIYDLNSN